jgi:hypothetical protein
MASIVVACLPIILHYFDGFGRGEVIRQILKSKGEEFEDRRFTDETWPDEKHSGNYDFLQLPMLEIDGYKLVH